MASQSMQWLLRCKSAALWSKQLPLVSAFTATAVGFGVVAVVQPRKASLEAQPAMASPPTAKTIRKRVRTWQ